jgi:hypothetical protein
MPGRSVEQRALGLLRVFEAAGKTVSRITIEGKRIELELAKQQDADEFAGLDMRYDKA